MLNVKMIGVAVVGAAAIGLSVGSLSPVEAATITYDFTANVTSGSLNGNQYTGFFSFDDTGLTGSGSERVNVAANGLEAVFNFLGTTYTEVDDEFYPSYPIADFLNGSLVGLSFGTPFNPGAGFAIGDASSGFFDGGSDFNYSFNFTPDGAGEVSYTLRSTPIPTPALLPGLIGMGIAAWRKRKNEESEQVAETAEV